MRLVRVIAPMGATVRGPARIALTPDQHKRRAGLVVEAKGKGVYDIPSGVALQFKHGEEFKTDALPKLNPALFEDVDAAKAQAKAKAAAAKAPDQTGDDTVVGGDDTVVGGDDTVVGGDDTVVGAA